MRLSLRLVLLSLAALAPLLGCDRSSRQAEEPPDEPSPPFRNVQSATASVGDSACASCHATEAAAYARHSMAQSFHRWTAAEQVEKALDAPLLNRPTGLQYSVVDSGGRLYQVEQLVAPDGRRLHDLRRPIDYVMGSGHVARTYFTEENGRLFQLPLTWYRDHGWDFSPGYEVNAGRFDRLLPDRCIACHSSYPRPARYMEGKYPELRPGIGCERCHGPGALHVAERRGSVRQGAPGDTAFDNSIVNPARLPLERRLDVCEQCHVHTSVSVPRAGRDAFSFVPSQRLPDVWAFFKVTGEIDVVSHADRLRQSACFIATRRSARPLECATCHDPHGAPPTAATRNQPCLGCHQPAALQRQVSRSARDDHAPTADCASCHMPRVQDRTVPHGTFTEHWIRTSPPERRATTRTVGSPIEAYYARDRDGRDAAVYRGMGEIVYANLAGDGRALREGAERLEGAVRALGADTARADARFLLGVALQQLGRGPDAIRALEQAARVDSTRPETLRALAQAYLHAGRPRDEVARLYQRALAAQPALAWIRAEYADVLQAGGKKREAERQYREAVAEQPSLSVAWFNLGTALLADARAGESAAAFREAVHLDPTLTQAVPALVEVRATGAAVTGARMLESPLPGLPGPLQGGRGVRIVVAAGDSGATFANVPPDGVVQIMAPDGSTVRTLRATAPGALRWDLRTDGGAPVGGGLHRVRVLARDPSGQLVPAGLLAFGVVRP